MPARKAPRAVAQGLHKRLKSAMTDLDWGPRDLQARITAQGGKVSYSAVYEWFRRGIIPDAYLLLLACRSLKIDIEWALTGEGSPAPRKRMDTSEAERGARLSQISATEAFLQGERARILSEADAAARAIGHAGAEARQDVLHQELVGRLPPLPPAQGAPGRRSAGRR